MGDNRDSNDSDLANALKEAARAASRDPDQAQIAADDAGGTTLAEGLTGAPAKGGVTIRGRVVRKRATPDPGRGSISGTVAGKPRDPGLGRISGSVAGRKAPATDTKPR